MTINIIAAVARNGAIGYQNKLIYWLPNDLKRFKQLTQGHTVIMGSNTFRSLPKGALPHRRNVVLTRKGIEGAEAFSDKENSTSLEFFPSLEEALQSCKTNEEVYIIGGASLYAECISMADRLCLTEIEDTPAQADTFFPDYSDWHIATKEAHPKDERHAFAYAFTDYVR